MYSFYHDYAPLKGDFVSFASALASPDLVTFNFADRILPNLSHYGPGTELRS